MSKHTPGPWAVNPMNAQVDEFGGQGMPLPVCHMLWPTDKRKEAETMANARLIAAAPDLLEALERILADGDVRDILGKADMSKARSAIAKARGGA
jgi:hypothetical protein